MEPSNPSSGVLVAAAAAPPAGLNAVAAAAASSTQARPHLTALQVAAVGSENTLNNGELQTLLQDARVCLAKMKGKCDVTGKLILDERATDTKLEVSRAYVAAALALLCGRFMKKNGKPNPSVAAEACGRRTKNPLLVTDWQDKLERLEAVLAHEDAGTMQLSGSSRPQTPAATPACSSTGTTHALPNTLRSFLLSEQHLQGNLQGSGLNQPQGEPNEAQSNVKEGLALLHSEASCIANSSLTTTYSSTDDLEDYLMMIPPDDDAITSEVVNDILKTADRTLLRLTFLKFLVATALIAGMNLMEGGALPHCEVFYTGAIRALLGDKTLLPYMPDNMVRPLRAALYETTIMKGDVFDRISTLHRALGTIAALELPNILVDQQLPQHSSSIAQSTDWERPTVDATVDPVDPHGSTEASSTTETHDAPGDLQNNSRARNKSKSERACWCGFEDLDGFCGLRF